MADFVLFLSKLIIVLITSITCYFIVEADKVEVDMKLLLLLMSFEIVDKIQYISANLQWEVSCEIRNANCKIQIPSVLMSNGNLLFCFQQYSQHFPLLVTILVAVSSYFIARYIDYSSFIRFKFVLKQTFIVAISLLFTPLPLTPSSFAFWWTLIGMMELQPNPTTWTRAWRRW